MSKTSQERRLTIPKYLIVFVDKFQLRKPALFLAEGEIEKIESQASWLGKQGWRSYIFGFESAVEKPLNFSATPLKFLEETRDFSSWRELLEQARLKARMEGGEEEERFYKELNELEKESDTLHEQASESHQLGCICANCSNAELTARNE